MEKRNDFRLALRLGEAARALGVTSKTLARLADHGIVPCKTLVRGRRRMRLFLLADLVRWLTSSRPSGDAPRLN